MKIINKTKNIVIAESLIEPQTLLDQSLGLLKYKTPVAMHLKTHFGIHTFWMRYPIDVMILDKHSRVVVIKNNLKPNNIFVWNIKYGIVLELPLGTIKKTKTELNDQLNFYTS